MSDPFDPRPITLDGAHMRLEPLSPSHAPDLLEVGRDESIWRYLPRPAFRDIDDARGWIGEACEAMQAGLEVVFAIIDRAGGRAVGSTRFMDIRRNDRGLEIGWTWIGVKVQRSAINTECKLLLLGHCFEVLGANRVQLKTDLRNERSQRAIERIGAQREGVLRSHLVSQNGYLRDSVFYSVIRREWPGVKVQLEGLIRKRANPLPL